MDYRSFVLFDGIPFLSKTEKWAVERELDNARQELDAIESARDAAEKKLQSLMRKCGVRRLPSASGRSITVPEDADDDEGAADTPDKTGDDDVDGNMSREADATFEEEM